MRIQKENAGSVNLAKRVLGLSVAMLTSAAAFMVAVPGAQAATYDATKDRFVKASAGQIDNTIPREVTLVKYLTSNSKGGNPTGSSNDETEAKKSGKAAEGVVYRLSVVSPKTGQDPADMKPGDTNSYNVDGPVFVGITDVNGKIQTGTGSTQGVGYWKKYSDQSSSPNAAQAEAHAKAQNAADALPTNGLKYYLLEELKGPKDVKSQDYSAPVIFSVPFRVTDDNDGDGYIYHVHVFPKNTSQNQLMKKASDIDRGGRGNWESAATEGAAHVQTGDKIRYHVTHALLNDGGKPNDGKLDVAEAKNANANPWLVIWDRLSPALQNGAIKEVKVTYSGREQRLSPTTDYEQVSQSTMPKALDNNTPMFENISDTEPGVNYVGIRFGSGHKGWLNQIDPAAKDVLIDIVIEATVGSNDLAAGQPGMLVNKAAADHVENKDESGNKKKPESAEEKTHSAGFQFAKVDTNGSPVAGAEFRLAKRDDTTQFLYSDGQYHREGYAGATVITATSNSQGVVTFVGIPLNNTPTATGVTRDDDSLNFALIEYKAPAGFKRIPIEFKTVSYNHVNGKTWKEVIEKNPDGVDRDKSVPLNFGKYGTTSNVKNENGETVTLGLMNWKEGEKGEPISLPLTGGKGIILLLVVGLAIMGGVLVVRNRKNAVKRV